MKLLSRWRGMVLPLLLLASWQLLSQQANVDPEVLVPPRQIVSAFYHSLVQGDLLISLFATVARALAGLAIGVVVGGLLGLWMGLYKPARLLFAPTFNAAQQIALFAWIPLLSAWVGTGESLKITEISLGALFPMLLSTRQAFLNVSEKYRDIGRLLELGRTRTLFSILLPAAMPTLLSGFETAFTIAWLGTIGTEYLIGTGYVNGFGSGLGIFLAAARTYGQMDNVIVGVITLALAGLVLNRLIVTVSRKLTPWLAH